MPPAKITVSTFAGNAIPIDVHAESRPVIAIVPAYFDVADWARWQAITLAARTNQMAAIIADKHFESSEAVLKLGIALYALKRVNCKVLGYLSMKHGTLRIMQAAQCIEIASRIPYLDGFFLDQPGSREHTNEIAMYLRHKLPANQSYLATHTPGTKDFDVASKCAIVDVETSHPDSKPKGEHAP